MNNSEKDVSIIFVNYKTKDLTINAINSVIEKTKGIEYEIFVVDNNSQDGSIEAIQEKFNGIELTPHPNLPREGKEPLPITGRDKEECCPIYIIKNPINAGFGAANNLAIKQAKSKYILCLNTDTLLINNAIQIMFDFMEKKENQNVGACGGILYSQNMKQTMSYCVFPNLLNSNSFHWLSGYLFPCLKNNIIKNNKEVDVIVGADIFFRESVLEEIGTFDENFFMFCEEVDLCKRIKNNGYNIKIVSDAKIIHLEGKSSKNFWSNTKMRVKSKYIYAHKHQTKLELYCMKISYILIHFIGFLFSFNKNHIDLIKEHCNR